MIYVLSLLASKGVPVHVSFPAIFPAELISSELGSVSSGDRLPQGPGNVGWVVYKWKIQKE